MDFSTINSAIAIQQQDARRAIRERELERVASERVAPVTPKPARRGWVIFGHRLGTAQ